MILRTSRSADRVAAIERGSTPPVPWRVCFGRLCDHGHGWHRVLERPTLVLNRNWKPVRVATVARSLTMLWNESAQVVDPDDFRLYTWADWASLAPREGEPFIRTVASACAFPRS